MYILHIYNIIYTFLLCYTYFDILECIILTRRGVYLEYPISNGYMFEVVRFRVIVYNN